MRSTISSTASSDSASRRYAVVMRVDLVVRRERGRSADVRRLVAHVRLVEVRRPGQRQVVVRARGGVGRDGSGSRPRLAGAGASGATLRKNGVRLGARRLMTSTAVSASTSVW